MTAGGRWEERGTYGPLIPRSRAFESGSLVLMVSSVAGLVGFSEKHHTYQGTRYKGSLAMRYLFRGGLKRESGAEPVAQSGLFGTGPSWSP